MNWWLISTAGLAAATWIGVVVWYSIRAKWWKTPIGWNTMAVSTVIVLIMIRVMLLLIVGPFGGIEYSFWRTFFGVFFYTALAFLGAQRVYFVESSQREARRIATTENRHIYQWDDEVD